jgi:hypothetical protein
MLVTLRSPAHNRRPGSDVVPDGNLFQEQVDELPRKALDTFSDHVAIELPTARHTAPQTDDVVGCDTGARCPCREAIRPTDRRATGR